MQRFGNKGKQQIERGFILVLVLWSVVLLALLAAGFSKSVRTYIRSATSDQEIARAEAFADGGVNLALLDLVSARQKGPAQRRFAPNGAAAGCHTGDGALVFIRIEDEAGKVNLNLANESLLAALFAGVGAPSDQASAYAARVLDFRDADDDVQPNGAEDADYAAAGSPVGPKNGPFDTIDELDQVLGLPPGFLDKVKPFITVHSGQKGVDTTTAPPVLEAILDAASAQSATGGLDRISGTLAEFASRSNRRAYTIHALARMPTGVQYVSQAVVEFPELSLPRYQLRQWRRGGATEALKDSATDPDDLPPC